MFLSELYPERGTSQWEAYVCRTLLVLPEYLCLSALPVILGSGCVGGKGFFTRGQLEAFASDFMHYQTVH